jgi:hypothetical protein
MASAAPKFDTKNIPLGSAPLDSTLFFEVAKGVGFEANAILTRMRRVGKKIVTEIVQTWQSSQLIGTGQSIVLDKAGQYQLQITCPYTSKKTTTIDMKWRTADDEDTGLADQSESFSGSKGAVARAIADVTVL